MRKRENKWSELSNEIKSVIGEPNEYLKTNMNYCDCNNRHHCYNISQEELKNTFGISSLVLYEKGLDYLLCKNCYVKQFGCNSENQATQAL